MSHAAEPSPELGVELLREILSHAVQVAASDIHVCPGEPVHLRLQGELVRLHDKLAETDSPAASSSFMALELWRADLSEHVIESMLNAEQQAQLYRRGSVDGAMSLDSENRFRFNVFRRAEQVCFAFRRLSNTVPTLNELGLHDRLYQLCNLKDGLVLVAGPTGSGKSTTIAALIDRINKTHSSHIVTIEDPVEFIHRSDRSLVNQRQIGTDVTSFNQALLDAVRQDPDVILVGELRDLDTIRTAITAAETGHLVFASVHAGDCKTAIERLISAFPAEEQNLAQRLVATTLRSVIVQHLLPRFVNPNAPAAAATELAKPQRVLASEVLHVNAAIANLIGNANLNQIASIIQTSGDEGMWTLDDSLAKLWRARMIAESTARSLARNQETLSQISRRRG